MSTLPCVAALIAALFAAPARDVLPPGHTAVTHELTLLTSAHFEAYELFAWPVRGFSGETRIVPGEPFQFSAKYGTRVFALDKGAQFPAAASGWAGNDPTAASLAEHGVRAVGAIPVTEQDSASVGSPIKRVLTRLRVVSIADGELQLEVVDEVIERDLSRIMALAGALSAGVVGLVMLARARRRAAAPDAR